jgi:hypothetical protein
MNHRKPVDLKRIERREQFLQDRLNELVYELEPRLVGKHIKLAPRILARILLEVRQFSRIHFGCVIIPTFKRKFKEELQHLQYRHGIII